MLKVLGKADVVLQSDNYLQHRLNDVIVDLNTPLTYEYTEATTTKCDAVIDTIEKVVKESSIPYVYRHSNSPELMYICLPPKEPTGDALWFGRGAFKSITFNPTLRRRRT